MESSFEEFTKNRWDTTKGPIISRQRAQFANFNSCLPGCSKCHLRPPSKQEDDFFITSQSGHDSTSARETTLHAPSRRYQELYLDDFEAPDIDETNTSAPTDLPMTLYATDGDVDGRLCLTSSTSSSSTTSLCYDSSDSADLTDVVGKGGILDFSSDSDSSSSIPELSPTSIKGKIQQVQEWFSETFFPKSPAATFELEDDFLS